MINLLNGLKEKYPSVTYADMYQLASALAIEVRSSGLACLASHIWKPCDPVRPPCHQISQAAVLCCQHCLSSALLEAFLLQPSGVQEAQPDMSRRVCGAGA